MSTWGRAFSLHRTPTTSLSPPWKENLLPLYTLTGSLPLSTPGSIFVSGIGPLNGCENCSIAKGAFLGCWANLTNSRIPDEDRIPGAPDWEDKFQGSISVEGDRPEDITLEGLDQTSQEVWRESIANLEEGVLAAAQQIMRCCCECEAVSVTWIVIDRVPTGLFSRRHRNEKGIIWTHNYIINGDGSISR